MSTTEKYFKIKNGLQFDDGTTLTTAPAGSSFSGSYTDLTNKPDLSSYASQTDVSTAISNLVATAPTTLDTLNELASALGNDANFATTVTTALGNKVNTSSLATVATSGDYNDLINKPSSSIPTQVSPSNPYDNTDHAILFGDLYNSTTQNINTGPGFNYNPVSGVLTANVFSGSGANLYNLPVPSQVTISSIDGNASDTTTYVPVFSTLATGAQAIHLDTGFTYNANTNVLNASGFTGAHNGTVGATTPNSGVFTTLSASATITLNPSNANIAITPSGTGYLTISSGAAGTINNMSIGSTTASTGKFTTLTATGTTTLATSLTGLLKATSGVVSAATAGTDYVAVGGALGTPTSGTVTNLTGTASININGTVGATTASTGRFTTLSASGAVTLSSTLSAGGSVGTSGQVLQSTGTGVQWATASGGGSGIILLGTGGSTLAMPTTLNAETTSTFSLLGSGGVSGVSVSTNKLTLPAGTYTLEVPYAYSSGSAYNLNIRNVTDGTNIDMIVTTTSNITYGSGTSRPVWFGQSYTFTLAASKQITFTNADSATVAWNMTVSTGGILFKFYKTA